jgi:EAL domain-containing protein (putative c-di-GMP-specific phosphodiesterase class I)
LAVVYQPIIDLRTARVMGAEALARIRGPEGTLIAPGNFISVAEQSGLIVPLGASVLHRACAQYDRWRSSGQSLEYVSVNISGRQLLARGLVDSVAASLERFGMAPRQLCLEFTETTIIDAGNDARRCVSELKDLGVQLALDDFGTGWSSLGHLRRFPFDVVKIDRSFVAGLGTNPEDGEVIRAVIGVGKALGMTILAEGIETTAQAEELLLMGCAFGQGNHFGRPRLPDEHAEHLTVDAPG